MKDHVTNKMLSIKLKEAGFEQESEFYWVKWVEDGNSKWRLISKKKILDLKWSHDCYKIASAFLATELLKWLPNVLISYGCESKIFVVSYYHETEGLRPFKFSTLQDALGEMLLYLKKEGLI